MSTQRDSEPLVALGVTGCVGAYKAVELLRRLQDRGYRVRPVLTAAAQRFVTPLTFQTLAGAPAVTGLFDGPGDWRIEHIALSDSMRLLLVAPATANTIAKFAAGIADDFLSTLYLSADCPVAIAPAMNSRMWRHAATRRNVETLKERGVVVVQPGRGYLACGREGEGRLAETEDIVDAAQYALRQPKTLEGLRVLVTAGPTAEGIDSIRFISNRSSGRMGYALAREAAARGAVVILISGPTGLRTPYCVDGVSVRTAAEMAVEVDRELRSADLLIMAAAVADFRPRRPQSGKIKKSGAALKLELEPTEDILARLGGLKDRPFLVGFAAESDSLRDNAAAKLKGKGLDMVVANPVAGPADAMGGDATEGLILSADGGEREIGRCPKAEMASAILDEVESRMGR